MGGGGASEAGRERVVTPEGGPKGCCLGRRKPNPMVPWSHGPSTQIGV